MPWTLRDAMSHTKKANTKKKKEVWSKTANEVLKSSGDEGKAVRIANSAVNKTKNKNKKK